MAAASAKAAKAAKATAGKTAKPAKGAKPTGPAKPVKTAGTPKPSKATTTAKAPQAAKAPVALDPAQRNEATVRRLYDALVRRDGDAMAACYAADATFEDPAFGRLEGAEVGAMWRMLTARATDLAVRLDYVYVRADGTAAARWVAEYTFARTGRRVRNVGEAELALRDGLIVRHADDFPFWRWSRQALGAPGWLLGWTPLLRSKVRRDARRQLAKAMAGGKRG